MPYQVLNDKKFLDYNGLTYFSRKLNNYPTNDVIADVIDAIQDALAEKQSKITANGILKGDGNGNITAAQASDFGIEVVRLI